MKQRTRQREIKQSAGEYESTHVVEINLSVLPDVSI